MLLRQPSAETVTKPQAAEAPMLRTLMAAAQNGDQQAYAKLLKASLPLIQRIARQNGIRPDEIDDVVQDTLLTIHRARHTFDPARPYLPWLRAIVQRRGIDVLRRTGRQASRELHAPAAYDAHPDPAEGADAHAASRRRADRLREAVAYLPPGQRQALQHLGLEELSLTEAAALTGRSTGALKVNLHRALRTLRGLLGTSE